MGVSRKIEDEVERRRLRQILDSMKRPEEVGFIIRTNGVGKTKAEIQRDLVYLTRLWQNFVKKRDSGPSPMELYTEGDLVSRTVRDVFTTDVDRIVCDNKDVAKRVKEVVKLANPRTANKVELYEDPIPLFHKYGIEAQIEMMHSRHVPLPSGGSLVIDSTEAIVAIDVNSGKFRDHSDAETTAFRTDMEAADEIPRQLRLRDLGGVIICDFIDLRYERHRRELEQRLHDNFANDRAKTRVLRMSQFGIIEITRQRMRPSLKRSIYFDCPHCKGAGLVKTPESMSLDVMRRLAIAVSDARVARLEMSVCPDVAFHLQNRKRQAIADLEARSAKPILIKANLTLGLDEVKLELFDGREGLVYLEELGMSPQLPDSGPSRRGGRQGGRDRNRHRDGPRQDHQHPPQRREEDPHSMDRVEEAVEEREEDLDQPTGEDVPGPHDAHVSMDVQAPPPGRMTSEPTGDGGPRRRRRRRGRRGRGGGGGGGGIGREPGAPPLAAEPQLRHDEPDREPGIQEQDSEPNFNGPPPLPGAPVLGEDGLPIRRRRRRRRGGRGRNRGGNRNQEPMGQPMDGPMNDDGSDDPPPPQIDDAEPAVLDRQRPRRRPPPPRHGSPPVQPRPIVVREPIVPTGSADRHLATDEPVAPPPPPRPRSYSDLDDIPDDFD